MNADREPKMETLEQSKEVAKLERDLQELAQLLLEIYLWRSEKSRQQHGTGEIDKQVPPGTMEERSIDKPK
jgi:t-SNARE complex subunit (syntaxin)